MSWTETSPPTHSSNLPLLPGSGTCQYHPSTLAPKFQTLAFILHILPTLGLESALLPPEGLPRRSGLQQAQVALISDLWCLNLPFPHSHYNLSTRGTGPLSRGEPASPALERESELGQQPHPLPILPWP